MTRLALILVLSISSLTAALAQPAATAQTTPAGALPQLRYGGALSSGAPYTFRDPGDPNKIIGFEVDIMNTLAERLGYRAVFVNNDWASLIPGLDTGLYDLVINGLEITSAHQAAADFSIPYYITFGQIVIRRGDPPLENLAALKGKRVGTLQASQMEYVLRAAGNIDVRVYDEEIDAYSDLKLGRIDATVMDFPIAVYYAKPDRALEFTGDPIGRIEYGIALKKGAHPDLLANINSALSTMLSDGTMHRILDRWALWTTMMAQATGDTRSMLAQPIDYDRFVEATEPTTWRGQFERYMRFLPQLGWAAVATVQISVLSMVLAVAFGAVLALCRVYGGVVLDRIAQVYIEAIRGTPLLIQLLFIYYGLPKIGLQLDPYVAGVLALGLNYAAYEAENYRAGLLAIPRHQMEAAIALNMTERQSLRYVVIPQAARIVVPPTTNDFISLLKDSSLVSVISLVELTKTYELLSTTYYDYFGTGLLVGAIYLLLGLPFVRLARWAERHLSRGMTRASS